MLHSLTQCCTRWPYVVLVDPLGLSASSEKCDPGFYCPGGNDVPNPVETPCPIGLNCPRGSPTPVPCQPGYFANFSQASTCLICPAGYYCVPEEVIQGQSAFAEQLSPVWLLRWPIVSQVKNSNFVQPRLKDYRDQLSSFEQWFWDWWWRPPSFPQRYPWVYIPMVLRLVVKAPQLATEVSMSIYTNGSETGGEGPPACHRGIHEYIYQWFWDWWWRPPSLPQRYPWVYIPMVLRLVVKAPHTEVSMSIYTNGSETGGEGPPACHRGIHEYTNIIYWSIFPFLQCLNYRGIRRLCLDSLP